MKISHTCQALDSSQFYASPVVFAVDSDPAVRETLRRLIRSAGCEPRFAVTAEEFLAMPRATSANCLLLELLLPGIGGLELQRLVADRAEMPVIFLSAHADVQATVRALKSGALEFLTKPCRGDVLIRAIRQAIERSQQTLLRLARLRVLQLRYETLSSREREVMSLVVFGRSNKQVGGELGISEATVKAHRGRLMRKMQAGSLPELVRMATELGHDAMTDAAEPDLIGTFTHATATLSPRQLRAH